MPADFRYLGPESTPRPNYQPWLQGEANLAAAKAAAFESLSRSIDRAADRRDRRKEIQDERAFQFDRDVSNRQFQEKQASDARAFAFDRDVAQMQENRTSAATQFGYQSKLEDQRSGNTVKEYEARAEMERKQREEQARQFQEATRLARMAQFDKGWNPVQTVKGVTLAKYMDELRAQGPDLPGYLGAQRDPTKAEGLLKMATEPVDVEYYSSAAGNKLAQTISERAGIRPEIATAAVQQLFGSYPTTFEDAMKLRTAPFDKARSIEAPVRQQTETGTLEPKVRAGTIDPSQGATLEQFDPSKPQGLPLSSDVLKQIGLQVTDIVPGVGAMAAGFDNELKKYSLMLAQGPNGEPVVQLDGPMDTAFGAALQKRISSPIEQDRLLGLLIGGPANTADELGRLGNAQRQRQAGGGYAPAPQGQAPQPQPSTPASAPNTGADALLPAHLQGSARQKVSESLFGKGPL